MSDTDKDSLLLNMVPGVGPRMYQKLMERFENPSAVLDASHSQLIQVNGLGRKIAESICSARDHIDVQQELDDCQRAGIRLVNQQSDEYPAELKEIHDPPAILYVKGDLLPQDRLSIAIVGSRHLSDYGAKIAYQFARGLSHCGFTIVSGLARGADGTAHEATITAGGRTLAVLGSGLMNLYPTEHADMANRIADNGAIISELPLHRAPHAGAFPQRNRIVSGLSLGVLVIEAGSRSGALITARHATEQGREVFAIPGRIDSRTSQGCNDLIRDGAKLVQSVDDILDELGPLTEPVSLKTSDGSAPNSRATASSEMRPQESESSIRQPAELKLSEQENQVLQAIATEPTYVDQIVGRTELPVQRVLATISVLQARRLVRRISGNQVARV